MSEVSARPLETDLFGVAIASARVEDQPALEEALLQARTMGTELLIVRVPAGRLETAQAVERAGGCLCDVLVTYALPVADLPLAPHVSPGICTMRRACAADRAAVSAVAQSAFSGFAGHWHTDSRLPASDADELYRRWAGDLISDSHLHHPVLVAEHGTEIGGFLALTRQDVGTAWYVPLAAVHPAFRGHGLLTQLLAAAYNHIAAHGGDKLEYETQLTNWPAIKVIARLGFVPSSAVLTFHVWL